MERGAGALNKILAAPRVCDFLMSEAGVIPFKASKDLSSNSLSSAGMAPSNGAAFDALSLSVL